MPGDQIGFEAEAVQVDRHGTFEQSGDHAICVWQALEFAGSEFVAFHDCARRKNLLNCLENHFLPLVHSEGGSLHYHDIFVLVENEAAQKIAFGIYDAKGGGVRQVLLPHG